MDSSNFVKKRQWKIAGALFLVICLITALVLYVLEDKPQIKKEAESVAVHMTSGGERVNAEALWRDQMEDAQLAFNKQVEGLQSTLSEQSTKDAAKEESIKALQAELLALQNQDLQQSRDPDFGTGESTVNTANPKERVPLIKKITLNLSDSKRNIRVKTILDTIPAGAFARAVTLSGMDASSAMNASSNPIPLLLRLIHPGTLPRKFESDLKDCHCTASGYGDISSERIHIRLEKLSCIEWATGEIVSTEVAGYVAGPDGREGIRGTLVSKEGQFLGRSAIGGVFSGLATLGSPRQRQGTVNPFGLGAQNPLGTKELFQSGFLEGTGSGMDKLSQYYINRAEQLQPVVQVPGGQVVDIVFTEAASIGDTRIKEAIAETRVKAREKIIKNAVHSEETSSNQPFYTGGHHENP